eukprot:3458586-Rhodomonas_salina.2
MTGAAGMLSNSRKIALYASSDMKKSPLIATILRGVLLVCIADDSAEYNLLCIGVLALEALTMSDCNNRWMKIACTGKRATSAS